MSATTRNSGVSREYFSLTTQQRLTVPLAFSKNTPVQSKGSLIYDPSTKNLHCSDGAIWETVPVGVTVHEVHSGTGIYVDNTDPENPVVNLSIIPNNTILGNNTGVPSEPQNLTTTQVTALLDLFSTSSITQGLVPGSNGATTSFLRGDGVWTIPAGAGTVTNIATNNGVTGGPITTTGTIGLAPIPANTIMGNDTGISAVPQNLTSAQFTSMIDIFTSTDQGVAPASGGGSINFLRADGVWAAPPGGGGSGTVTSISTNDGITGGPITTTGTIGLAPMPANTLKGNNTGGSAVPTDLSGTQVTAMLDLFSTSSTTKGLVIGSNNATTSYLRGDDTWRTPTQVTASLDLFTNTLQGLTPASGGGTANYLRADGTWAAPPGATSGTVTNIATNNGVTGGPITTTGTIGLAAMPANTLKGNNTGGSAVPTDLTGTQTTAMLDLFSTSSTTKGLVNGSNSATTSFLRGDDTWQTPATITGVLSLFSTTTTAQGVVPGSNNGTSSYLRGDQTWQTPTQITSQLNLFTNTLQGLTPASGGGTVNYLRADGTWAAPPGATSGTVTNISTNNGVTGGPITTTGTIGLAAMPATTIKGNATGGSAVPTDLTGTQVTAMLDLFDTASTTKGLVPGSNTGTSSYLRGDQSWQTPTVITSELDIFTTTDQGVVPGSGGGTVNYLRADGTWAAPPGATSGTVTNIATNNGVTGGPITTTGTIGLAAMPANTLKGNNTGGSAVPTDLTGTQVTAMLDLFDTASTTKGLVSGSNSATTSFLRGDDTWRTPAQVTAALSLFSTTTTAQGVVPGSNNGTTSYLRGDSTWQTPTQVTAALNLFTTSLQGLTPASGGGTVNYLRADGTWAAPPGATSGTVTNIATNNGVTGGPITTTGTIGLAAMPATTIKGNATGGSAVPTDLTGTQVTALLDLFDTASTTKGLVSGSNSATTSYLRGDDTWQTPTTITSELDIFTSTDQGVVPGSGGGTVNYLRADGTWAAPPGATSGTVTNIATNNGVTGGPITTTGTIGLAAMPATTIKGNATGGSAVPTDLTGTQVTAMLDLFSTTLTTKGLVNGSNNATTSYLRGDDTWRTPTQVTASLDLFTTSLQGLTPASGGGTVNYLRADGTWAAPPGATSGTVTNIATNNGITGGPITTTGTIGLAAMPATTIKGNNTGGSAVPTDLTGTQVTALLDLFDTASTTKGLVSGSNSATTSYLRGDDTWQTPATITAALSLFSTTTTAQGVVPGSNNGTSSYLRGDSTWQTPTQVTASLDLFTSLLQGLTPASGGGTTNYLRADGTWAAPPGATSGTVTNIATNNGVTGGPITTIGTIGLAAMPATTIKGNATGGSAVPTDLTGTQVTAMLDVFSTTATTQGLVNGSNNATTSYLRGDDTWQTPATITTALSLFSTTTTAQGVVPGSNNATTSFLRGDQTWRTPTQITAALDLFSTTTTAQGVVPGSNNGTSSYLRGDSTWQTPTQVTAALDLFTTSLQGLTPASGGGTTNYLRADGTWAAPPGATSGTVTNIATNNGVTGGPITTTGTIGLAAMPATTIKGNNTGGSAVPTDLTGTQVTAMLDLFATAATTKGLVNGSNNATTSYLRGDDTWQTPATITAALSLFSTTTTAQGVVPGSNNGTSSYLRGDQTWQTPTQVTASLDLFTTSLQGLTPASGGGTTNYLRADGTWAAPPGTGSGTVTNIATNNGVTGGPITTTGTIGLAAMAATTIKGNATGGSAVPTDLTGTQVTAMLDTFSTAATTKGLVNGSNGGTTSFLRGDNTWRTATQVTAVLDLFSTSATTRGLVIGSNGNTSSFLRGDDTWQLPSQVTAQLSLFSSASTAQGVVPGSNGATTSYLRGDQTWQTPANVTAALSLFSTAATTQGVVPGSNGGTTSYLRGDQTWRTPTQVTAALDVFTSVLKGLAPASGGGTTNYLRADGTWTIPTISSAEVYMWAGAQSVGEGNSAASVFGPTASNAVTHSTIRPNATTITPVTTVYSGVATFNTTTGATTTFGTFIGSSASASGSIDLSIGYSDPYVTSSFTALCTTSIPWNAAALETVTQVNCTWSPTSATLPANKVLVIVFTNNLLMSGSGSIAVRVPVKLS